MYGNAESTLGPARSNVAKEIKLEELLDFCMPLGSEREDWRSCWNLLFVLSLAKDSTHLFCFMYCRLNTGTIEDGSAGKVDLEADEE